MKDSDRKVKDNVNLEKYSLENKIIDNSKNIKTRSKSEEDKRSNRDKADRITKAQLNEIKNNTCKLLVFEFICIIFVYMLKSIYKYS